MIRTGEPNDYAAEILFYLPKVDDPLQPKTSHVFTLGEVRIKLSPSDPSWTDIALDRIIERGGGWYAIRLTAAQRATATTIAYEAVCAGAQPDRGTEVIGDLSGDIAEGGSGVIPFYLANEDDPIEGAPIEGHVFVLGEVKLALPDDAFGNVATEDIVEFGGGLYGVLLDETQTTKRGKAIVIAEVAGAQRFSGHRTILGDGALVPPSPPLVPGLLPATESTKPTGGDLLLVWSNVTGTADLSRIEGDADLASDRGLMTAVILSLFTDRRAEVDDKPPSGDDRDRRGWWADEFLEVEGDKYGSRLWLLDRSKATNETVLRAKEYIREALAWMLEDRVVSRVEAVAEITARPMLIGDTVVPKGTLLLGADLHRPGRDPVSFRFAHTWDHLQEDV